MVWFEQKKFDPENKDNLACNKLRLELKVCLLESECCQGPNRRTPKVCLQEKGEGVEPCLALARAFSECKRSMIDPRSRFRGIRQ